MRAVLALGPIALAVAIFTSHLGATANAAGTAFGWSGYAIERGQPYSSAAGSWTVPRISYQNYPGSSQTEFSATWVGIGGDGADKTLIQLGTAQNIDAAGTTKYFAWYLLVSDLTVPATPIPFPVDAGDKITASIKCVANCVPNANQSWLMTMTNSTKGWTWNNNGVPFSYQSSMGSAEWIMEDPVLQGPGALPRLPKFGSATFTDITANEANPNLSLLTDAITMIAPDGSPTSIPTAAANGNSFTVNQVGLPPAVPFPNQPTFTSCSKATTDLGALGSQTAAGQFSGLGQDVLFRFYLPQYEIITAFPLAQLKFSYSYIDDNTGAQLPARHGTEQAPIFASLDPGYYCLRVFNPMALGVQFQVQMSGQTKGVRPGATKQMAPPVALLDIGNLTPNGYYEKSRYINDGNFNVTPALAPGHIYTLRDWVGAAATDQFYIFSLDRDRRVSVELANLYLGAAAIIETQGGAIVGETVESGTPLTPRPPGQKFEGLLPAGTYYLHVTFAGVGGPGTPYAVALTAQ